MVMLLTTVRSPNRFVTPWTSMAKSDDLGSGVSGLAFGFKVWSLLWSLVQLRLLSLNGWLGFEAVLPIGISGNAGLRHAHPPFVADLHHFLDLQHRRPCIVAVHLN